jgi:hypothetical protein
MKAQTTILLLAAVFATAAHAASRGDAAAYGQPVSPNSADRVIELTPQTRFVNVTNGETVTFEKGGQRFTWHVDTFNNVAEFALAKISPNTMNINGVEVYVAPGEYYRP